MRMPNRLARETSPYLLQHQNNPVDWYPWGPEALERARRESKPIFLSVGYSACHWCHVMAHESFENEEIAQRLNDWFVCIKVDREERPDLDQIYMQAVQMMTGRGGWPMSVFLTTDLRPFYGGTYWPPSGRMGMPGFDQILAAVHSAWTERQSQIDARATELAGFLQRAYSVPQPTGGLRPELLSAVVAQLERVFDPGYGGFGGAPKFPHSIDLQLLLRIWRRHPRSGVLDMVTRSLDHMAHGGIYDHLGGGFARYATDQRWLVPHFEKMLYDNALLATAYLEAFQVTGQPLYDRVTRETLDYILRDMTDPTGGFHAAEDADSEGEEGRFYVWTLTEIQQVLEPPLAERFTYVYDVTAAGNWEGHTILNLPKTLEQCAELRHWDREELESQMADARRQLLAVRERRVRPGRDDKVLVGWNALAIDALARASGVLNDRRYLAAAVRAADFIWSEMRRPDGRLLHSWRQGRARFDAYLDDYAGLLVACVSLYEATFDERWIGRAMELAGQLLRHFADPQGAGFYFTADDHETLILRTRDMQDSSTPSGSGLAATGLLKLGRLCGRNEWLEAADRTLTAGCGLMEASPTAAGQLLLAYDLALGPAFEVALLADSDAAAVHELVTQMRRRFQPHATLACRTTSATAAEPQPLDPLFAGRTAVGGQPTAYVCRDGTCELPRVGNQAILEAWEALAGSSTDAGEV